MVLSNIVPRGLFKIANGDADSFLERHQRTLNLETSPSRAILSLKNWDENTGALASKETKYLDRKGDLFSLAADNSTWLERNLALLLQNVNQKFKLDKSDEDRHGYTIESRDKNVLISSLASRKGVRVLLAPVIAALLLTPVIICNYVNDLTYRVIIVVLTTSTFIATLAFFTQVKAIEWVVAGATYVILHYSTITLSFTLIANINHPPACTAMLLYSSYLFQAQTGLIIKAEIPLYWRLIC